MTWLLFVDESGNFDDPEDAVLVGGWLVRHYDTFQLQEPLAKAMGHAVPYLLYPPHAADLNLPVAQVVGYLADPQRVHSGHPHARLCREAVSLLQSSNAAPARELVQAVTHKNKSLYDVLSNANRWVRTNHGFAMAQLRQAQAMFRADWDQLLQRVQQQFGPTGSMAVAAWQGPTPGAAGAERYLGLLEVLMERCLQCLHGHNSVQNIWFRVAERRGLTEQCLRSVFGKSQRTGPFARFQAVPREPAAYRAHVHPGIVLADFITNRLRNRLGAQGWSGVREASQQAIRFPVEASPRFTAAGPLPTIAADGLPRLAIQRAFRKQPRLPLELDNWAGQQAQAWVNAIEVQ